MSKKYAPGEKIRITLKNQEFNGIVMQRSELDQKEHITLKLDNGYNIGVKTGSILDIESLGTVKSDDEYETKQVKISKDLPSVSILATGGTIASRVDYMTGGVFSAFTAEELISAVPEIADIANVSGHQIFNKFSENIQPSDWVKIAKEAYKQAETGVDGIVISHGTDTMGYTASALSFMLSSSIPIVLTGAQRSGDRGSSDAATNLYNSVLFASKADYGGVCVLMHEDMGDDSFLVHAGTKVRKLHSSRRDAFKSVNSKPLASIKNSDIEYLQSPWKSRGGDNKLDTRIEEKVAFIKYHPGLTEKIIDFYVENGYKGILLEGTGLGHVSESLFKSIGNAIGQGLLIVMSTQTIFGRVNMTVYSTGRMLKKLGVLSCGDIMPETAYVKLCCVLGQAKTIVEAKEKFESDPITGFSD